jgi:hypothetical protein
MMTYIAISRAGVCLQCSVGTQAIECAKALSNTSTSLESQSALHTLPRELFSSSNDFDGAVGAHRDGFGATQKESVDTAVAMRTNYD